MRLVLSLSVVVLICGQRKEPICLNGCSGHGECSSEFVCSCFLGWGGDDCSHQIVRDASIPIFGAGHFNLTTKNFSSAISRFQVLLVGFSSTSCDKCLELESEYEKATRSLTAMGIPFGRSGDRSRMEDLGLTSLPAIGAYVKGRGHAYLGPHSARCLVEYADKLKSPVISPYSETFFANQKCVGEILVVGVFREDEDDDYREDFEEVAAGRLWDKDAFFSIVVGQPALAFLDAGRIDRTPGLLLLRRDGSEESASLDALDLDLDTFVDSKSLPLVGELTAQNFARYEKLRRPMFLLFLDLRARGNEENVVGGRSGGLFNDDLAAELASVARDESFRDRVTFAYCDGVMYGDRMKSLGLFGGRESLPALAFNAGPGSAAPYPESLPIRKEYLRDFVAAFLSRKILSEKDSELFALTKKQHLGGNFMKPRRKPKKKAPKERVGVSEQFGASSKGAEARGKVDSVVELTTENFETEAPEHKDVMIAFHDESCRKCANLAVYYKKVAERFDEEGIDSLVVGRFDTTKTASIPGLESLDVAFDRLPTILFLPAFAKRAPPYVFYSGVSKVQPIMRWAQQVAAISFDLPDLCHLSPEDRILYKEQVTEIENARRKREEEL